MQPVEIGVVKSLQTARRLRISRYCSHGFDPFLYASHVGLKLSPVQSYEDVFLRLQIQPYPIGLPSQIEFLRQLVCPHVGPMRYSRFDQNTPSF